MSCDIFSPYTLQSCHYLHFTETVLKLYYSKSTTVMLSLKIANHAVSVEPDIAKKQIREHVHFFFSCFFSPK